MNNNIQFIRLETRQWGWITLNKDMITFFTSSSDTEPLTTIYTVDNRVITVNHDDHDLTVLLNGGEV